MESAAIVGEKPLLTECQKGYQKIIEAARHQRDTEDKGVSTGLAWWQQHVANLTGNSKNAAETATKAANEALRQRRNMVNKLELPPVLQDARVSPIALLVAQSTSLNSYGFVFDKDKVYVAHAKVFFMQMLTALTISA
ncbi:hypothetical protein F5878DRAFT_663926 [Lentinula raphanica]|uniref:Uncharacterized protein n=1 Tax=Lentinula raphanica TaxID=153919 RepID=A0AA38UB20_9AGAR|nr:hypothetical protein F5878DRAFT_663926 [Lentinula raphanica]